MKIPRNLFLIVAVFAASFAAGCQRGGVNNMAGAHKMAMIHICYYPIYTSAFKSIGMITISKSCTELDDVPRRNGAIEDLKLYIARAPTSEFDDQLVRVKITMTDGSEIYINKNGEVRLSNKTVRLLDKDMRKLSNVLERMYNAKIEK